MKTEAQLTKCALCGKSLYIDNDKAYIGIPFCSWKCMTRDIEVSD